VVEVTLVGRESVRSPGFVEQVMPIETAPR
jgi:hypothetical protein